MNSRIIQRTGIILAAIILIAIGKNAGADSFDSGGVSGWQGIVDQARTASAGLRKSAAAKPAQSATGSTGRTTCQSFYGQPLPDNIPACVPAGSAGDSRQAPQSFCLGPKQFVYQGGLQGGVVGTCSGPASPAKSAAKTSCRDFYGASLPKNIPVCAGGADGQEGAAQALCRGPKNYIYEGGLSGGLAGVCDDQGRCRNFYGRSLPADLPVCAAKDGGAAKLCRGPKNYVYQGGVAGSVVGVCDDPASELPSRSR